MTLDLITLSVPLFFAGVLIEVLANRMLRRDFYVLGDSLGSLGTGVLDQLAIVLTRAALFTAPYVWLYHHFALTHFEEFTFGSFVFGLILADLGYYWAHRFTHEVSFLWAGHVVHHSSEEYNLTTALRQNWFSSWFLYMFNMPMAIAGISPKVATLIIPFIQLYQFWIHTRMLPKLGFLEKIVNTPSNHRVHHGINPEYVDKNYGAILIIWDRMFGTYEEERAPVVYGVLKPLQSFNPLRAWFSPWVDLFRAGSLRAWLKPPGWDPATERDPDLPALFAEARKHRFHPRLPGRTGRLAAVWFISVLLSAAVYLFLEPKLAKPVSIAIAGGLAAILTAYGFWIDRLTTRAA